MLGLGYVGLPLACAAAEAGHRVTGYDPDRARVAGLREGRSPVEDVEDRWLEKVLGDRAAVLHRRPGRYQGKRHVRHLCPHPAEGEEPGPEMVDSAVDVVADGAAPGRHGDPRVDDLSRHDRGPRRATADGGHRAARARRLPPGLLARAHRPRQPRLLAARTPPGSSGASGRRRVTPPPRSTRRSSTGAPRVRATRGRDGQAPGEHLPAREHRTGQRDGHLLRRAGHRPVGGHRRRVDQAVRLRPVHTGAGGRRALHPGRPVLPLLARTPARLPVPVRRAGRRDQRPDARTTSPSRIADLLNDVHKSVAGSRILVLGRGLQARPGRPAGVARPGPDPSAGEPRGPGSLARPARPRARDRGPGGRRRRG